MKTSLDEIKKKAIPILKEAGVIRSSIFGSWIFTNFMIEYCH